MKKKIYFVIISVLLITGILVYKIYNGNLINDFYDYINKIEINKIKLKENEVTKSKFSIAQENVDKKVDLIVKDLLKNDNNMNKLYSNLTNIDKRNEEGIKPLKKYLDKLEESDSFENLVKNMMDIDYELGLNVIMPFDITGDLKNSSQNVVYFAPVSFDFNAPCSIYNDKNYDYMKAYYKRAGLRILKEYGYSKKEARKISEELNNMYESVCSVSLTTNEMADYNKVYNRYSKKELMKLMSNIDVEYFLNLYGINNQEYFIVNDINNYKKMNEYFNRNNFKLLKEYFVLMVLENYSDTISINYLDINIDLNNSLMGKNDDKNKYEDNAKKIIENYFSSEIDEVYLKNNFTNEDKIYIEGIINDIINYFKNNFNSYKWMDEKTRNEAINKLNKMKVNVGGPVNHNDIYKKYNIKLYSEGGNLVDNAIDLNKNVRDYKLSLLNNKTDEWLISVTTVNAYYNILDNSINFPASLSELYNKDADYYTNLGSIGMIVAHEITHAFDSGGALFDSNGNMNDWWSEKDKKEFEKLTNKVIDYYNGFEVINGLYLDGKKTIRENIADLGAVNAITEIAKGKNATNEEMKKMYKSFASMWLTKNTDEYTRLLYRSDTHSPNNIRVNATLSSIDEFYNVYNINRNDDMFVEKDKRVKIW